MKEYETMTTPNQLPHLAGHSHTVEITKGFGNVHIARNGRAKALCGARVAKHAALTPQRDAEPTQARYSCAECLRAALVLLAKKEERGNVYRVLNDYGETLAQFADARKARKFKRIEKRTLKGAGVKIETLKNVALAGYYLDDDDMDLEPFRDAA